MSSIVSLHLPYKSCHAVHAFSITAAAAATHQQQTQVLQMANMKACLVLLVLALSSAAMAAAVDLAALEEAKFQLPNPKDLLDPGRIVQCWAPIMGIEGCVKDVLSSFLSFFHQVHLSPECCSAIEAIDKNCFHSIFSSPPFNLFFPPLLKTLC